MGKFGKELIESMQQAAKHAAGKRVRGLRVHPPPSGSLARRNSADGRDRSSSMTRRSFGAKRP